MFPSKVDKKYALVVLCQHYTENVTRIKLGPGTYQLFLLLGVKCACTHMRLCIQVKSGKMSRFFYFLKAFFVIKSG